MTSRSPRAVLLSFLTLVCLALIGLTPAADAGTATQETLGQGPGDALGVVVELGDLDGDGKIERAVGSPLEDNGAGVDAGAVRVLSGADGSVLMLLEGDRAGGRLGRSIAAVGDLDGDGTTDLALGAPATGAAGETGRVFLVSGASGAVLSVLQGAEVGSEYGHAVSAAGDLDGDGTADLVVGAPGHDGAGVERGAAFLVSGADGTVIEQVDGDGDGDRLGLSVDGGGTAFSDPDSGVAIGAEQGGAGGQGKGYTRLYDRATLALSATFTGASAWDRLGSVVRYVGDVDGDGKADLAVGTDPRDAAGDPTALGYVRVLSGADGTEIHAFSGAALDTGYGSRLAALGDVDGDGFADLAIGAPRADLNFVDAGFIEVRSGADGSILQKVSGQAAGDLFGQSLASAGDVDGDGSADLAVASPGSDVAAPDAGLVQVISFETWANLGAGVAGSGGIVPKLEGEGSLEPLSEVTLTLTDALPLADVDLVLGYSAYVDPLTGCLAPVPDVIVEGLQTDAAGDLTYVHTWPAVASEAIVYYQFLIADPEAPGGQARSNTLSGRTP